MAACSSRRSASSGVTIRAGMPTAVAPGRHVAHDDGVRADLRAVADVDRPEDLGAGADDHALAERRVPLALVPRRAAERDAVVERAVVADFRRLADHDPHAVVDEHPPPDRGAGMDLDAGQEAAPVREPAGEPAKVGAPQAVHDHAMPDERVQAGVARQDFPRRAGGRVAVEDDADVFAESVEHVANYALVRVFYSTIARLSAASPPPAPMRSAPRRRTPNTPARSALRAARCRSSPRHKRFSSTRARK